MLDPQAECPDCGAKLGARTNCRGCGWTPVLKKGAVTAPAWERPDFVPPTPEELLEIHRLIEEVAAKLGAATAPHERKPLAHLPKRCPKCDTGNFVHMGVRYCLDGYLGRH